LIVRFEALSIERFDTAVHLELIY